MLTTPPSLLERLRLTPERAAWEKFVELYTPILFAWTRRLGLPPHESADLVQDIFTVLVEKLPHFEYDPSRSFRAWLKTVLLNRWRNHLRSRAGGQPRGLDGVGDVPGPEEAGFEEAEYRSHLAGRALALMQAEFQPPTWRACWEVVVEGRPAAEVAAELGLSVNAVYLAKGRVLRRLREELDGLFD
jgi:RNA polymerase sigma-70 factor (ECF subfamily)